MSSTLEALFGLNGRTALITGATSGIGRCVAELFIAAGAKVVATGRTAGKVAEVLTSLRELASDDRSEAIAADLSQESDVERLFELADRRFGGIDILVGCAGIYPSVPFLESTVALWDQVHEVNTRSAYLCNREAIRRMKSQGRGGSIVNVSSVASRHSFVTGHAHYGSSKAGVNMLTRSLALEFGGDGIRVNAVLPGTIDTEGLRTAQAGYATEGRNMTGPVMQAGRLPMGRVGTVSDVANLCLFLASPASGYVTGQLIAVDGGFELS